MALGVCVCNLESWTKKTNNLHFMTRSRLTARVTNNTEVPKPEILRREIMLEIAAKIAAKIASVNGP